MLYFGWVKETAEVVRYEALFPLHPFVDIFHYYRLKKGLGTLSGHCACSYAMDLMHHWQPCFRTVSAILIVLSTVVAKDAISSFHVQSDPSTDSLSSISLLGWLKTCPEDLAKHAGAFLLMAAR